MSRLGEAPQSFRLSMASATLSFSIGFDVEIGPSISMPVGAVGSLQLSSDKGIASEKIGSTGNWFKMRRIHAGPISTEVIQLKATRNRANQDFVSLAMCIARMLREFQALSITVVAARGCPFPARAKIGPVCWRFADANLRPEAWGESIVAEEGGAKLSLHREVFFPGVTRQAVYVSGAAAHSFLGPF